MRAKLKVIPFDEKELASDYRYQHYLQIATRIEIYKQEVLTRIHYTDTGTTSLYEILLSTQLL